LTIEDTETQSHYARTLSALIFMVQQLDCLGKNARMAGKHSILGILLSTSHPSHLAIATAATGRHGSVVNRVSPKKGPMHKMELRGSHLAY